jgi:hypothetical protein
VDYFFFLSGGDSVPEPLGFNAFVPECLIFN